MAAVPAASTAKKVPAQKRLIVACDGTWMDLDRAAPSDNILPSWVYRSPMVQSLVAVPSNVTRICRAIARESDNNIPQIVYYSAGVGSGSLYDRVLGGATGSGIDDNIRESYAFIQSNWNPGDEIVLIGFSRGAFTARSIGAFLTDAGILTRTGMNEFQNVFEDWECQLYDGYQSHWPADLAAPERPKFSDGSYGKMLAERKLTHLNVPIKAIAVWDTVGSLGIPDIGPFAFRKRLAFVNCRVSSSVEFAFQALALDEERKSFSPTVWEFPEGDNRLKVLSQCWFPGVHSNIGSGYADTEIADLTLSWMITKLRTHGIIDFVPDAVIEHRELGIKWATKGVQATTSAGWGLGTLYQSMTTFYWINGRYVRRPGRNQRVNPKTGIMTDQRLSNTHETVHPSVRIRIALGGKGVGSHKVYKPASLDKWQVVSPAKSGKKGYTWTSDFGDGDTVELPEEQLEGLELDLLKASPGGIYEVFENSESATA